MKQGINPNFHDYSIDNSMEGPWLSADPGWISSLRGMDLTGTLIWKPKMDSSQPPSHLQTRVTIFKSLIFRIWRVKYPYIQKQTLIVTTCQSFVFASF